MADLIVYSNETQLGPLGKWSLSFSFSLSLDSLSTEALRSLASKIRQDSGSSTPAPQPTYPPPPHHPNAPFNPAPSSLYTTTPSQPPLPPPPPPPPTTSANTTSQQRTTPHPPSITPSPAAPPLHSPAHSPQKAHKSIPPMSGIMSISAPSASHHQQQAMATAAPSGLIQGVGVMPGPAPIQALGAISSPMAGISMATGTPTMAPVSSFPIFQQKVFPFPHNFSNVDSLHFLMQKK